MKFSKYQLDVFNAVRNTNQNICVQATAGCLGINTSILMYDGSIKMVQEIEIGDEVMGIDSTKRIVISINSGKSQLYRVIPVKGDSWICNDKHIMTVHSESLATKAKKHKHISPLIDIDLKTLQKQKKQTISRGGVKSNNISNYRLQRFGVDFEKKQTEIDPYIMGLWLGDGQSGGSSIYTVDQPIIDYLLQSAPESIIRQDKTCQTVYLKQKTQLQKNIYYSVFSKIKKKFIPQNYLINDKENRLQLLAGLIDSDGYVGKGYIEFTLKEKQLAVDIVFLCRSLGLAAYSKQVKRKSQTGYEGNYTYVSISGDLNQIPVKLIRKQSPKRKQIKNVLRTGFSIEDIGEGQWYGFSVDKDNRFLLGDFTVTHNSGKTTTLLEILNLIPKFKKTIFLSFSNTIVKELKQRVPVHATASTLHSLGCRIIFRNKKGLKIDNDKWFKILVNTFDEAAKKDKKTFKMCYEMVDIINYARMTLTPFNKEKLTEMCDYYSINYTEEHLNIVIYQFQQERKMFSIDFTDMIYLPVKMNLIDEQFDYILLDEAQDLNNAQRLFIEKILKPGGRLIAVGDENQSIYSFSGSSIDSFQKLQQRPNTITLPLSISYRCAKNVVRKAQEVYPEAIQYFEQAEEGEARIGSIEEIKDGDLVICRKTAPLITVFFQLLKRRIKAQIVGKDIETGLLNLAEKIQTPSLELTLTNLEQELVNLDNELKAKGFSKPEYHPRHIALEEKIEVIKVILYNISSPHLLVVTIKDIFSQEKRGIKLMTIHRSKGLECERVFVIEKYNGDRQCPSSRATQKWEKIQESNLLFVAYTRAKRQLIQLEIVDEKFTPISVLDNGEEDEI